jgi:glycosyltransferase involved in cell wall biosynthesis
MRQAAEAGPPSISIVIPARNEAGNIEDAITRLPDLGGPTQLIFVEGGSSDNTWDEIQRVAEVYSDSHDIAIAQQEGIGKGDAVRKGFSLATGDILTILDADLTMPPEDMPKYVNALASGKAEFANGCRLIYPLERESMRFLNMLANHFFSHLFSWLLSRRIKDTLCGTKMLFREDYDRLAANRAYFGEFDPFGDFDLLFGAARMNLRIVDIPIHYKSRQYGDTNISRWRHGLLLLRMSQFAMWKIKFI